MPRASQRTSQHSQLSQESQSQSQLSQTEINLNIDEQVNDLVRYIVNRAGEHMIFKRAEFKKNVLSKAGPNFEQILNKSTDILRNVYGYNVMVVDAKQNSTKAYVISNRLPYVKDPTERTEEGTEEQYPNDVNKILLLLILSHIYMSNNSVTEASLYSFLRSLKIDVEIRHEIFGNVKDYIIHTLKNKKYLDIEMDQMSKKTFFSWGPRAESEISKHEILKFVCKIYQDRQPAAWINQFKVANEQHFENYRENLIMEVEP